MIDYFPVVGPFHPIDLQRWGFVDQIEKSREGLAQANAAATTMTDVIDSPQFGKKFFLVENSGSRQLIGCRVGASRPPSRIGSLLILGTAG